MMMMVMTLEILVHLMKILIKALKVMQILL